LCRETGGEGGTLHGSCCGGVVVLLNGCAERLEVWGLVLLNRCAVRLEVKAHFVLLNGCAERLEVKAHCTVRVVAAL
jgi:hypothetical protein